MGIGDAVLCIDFYARAQGVPLRRLTAQAVRFRRRYDTRGAYISIHTNLPLERIMKNIASVGFTFSLTNTVDPSACVIIYLLADTIAYMFSRFQVSKWFAILRLINFKRCFGQFDVYLLAFLTYAKVFIVCVLIL